MHYECRKKNFNFWNKVNFFFCSFCCWTITNDFLFSHKHISAHPQNSNTWKNTGTKFEFFIFKKFYSILLSNFINFSSYSFVYYGCLRLSITFNDDFVELLNKSIRSKLSRFVNDNDWRLEESTRGGFCFIIIILLVFFCCSSSNGMIHDSGLLSLEWIVVLLLRIFGSFVDKLWKKKERKNEYIRYMRLLINIFYVCMCALNHSINQLFFEKINNFCSLLHIFCHTLWNLTKRKSKKIFINNGLIWWFLFLFKTNDWLTCTIFNKKKSNRW